MLSWLCDKKLLSPSPWTIGTLYFNKKHIQIPFRLVPFDGSTRRSSLTNKIEEVEDADNKYSQYQLGQMIYYALNFMNSEPI
jgi:hypothetical protein